MPKRPRVATGSDRILGSADRGWWCECPPAHERHARGTPSQHPSSPASTAQAFAVNMCSTSHVLVR